LTLSFDAAQWARGHAIQEGPSYIGGPQKDHEGKNWVIKKGVSREFSQMGEDPQQKTTET